MRVEVRYQVIDCQLGSLSAEVSLRENSVEHELPRTTKGVTAIVTLSEIALPVFTD